MAHEYDRLAGSLYARKDGGDVVITESPRMVGVEVQRADIGDLMKWLAKHFTEDGQPR